MKDIIFFKQQNNLTVNNIFKEFKFIPFNQMLIGQLVFKVKINSLKDVRNKCKI